VQVLAGLPQLSGPGMGLDTAGVGKEIASLVGAGLPPVPGRSVMEDLAGAGRGK
jgi:3-isopropylmalate dehydrogenase